MGLISNKISRNDVKEGDHIYSWRNIVQSYAHHGIYVGNGEVIHFTRPRTKAEIGWGDMISFSSSPNQCLTCISCRERSRDRSTFSGVMSSCLNCFLDGGKLYRYEYDVKPAAFIAKTIGGTCTLATSDPPEVVILRAQSLLRHQYAFGNYKLFKKNCETFALYCKTGLMVSKKTGQANSVSATSGVALVVALVGLQTLGYAIYSYGRLESDIGNKQQKGVTKIPVEDLVASGQCYEQK